MVCYTSLLYFYIPIFNLWIEDTPKHRSLKYDLTVFYVFQILEYYFNKYIYIYIYNHLDIIKSPF